MKKYAVMLMVVMMACLTACSGGKNQRKSGDRVEENVALTGTVRREIEGKMPRGLSSLLWEEDDAMTVLVQDGTVNLTFRVAEPCCIPWFADGILPVARAACQDAGGGFGHLTILSYRENADGLIEGTMASWKTDDLQRGMFVDDSAGMTKPAATVAWMHEYYSEYEQIMKDWLQEAGWQE